MYFQSREGCSTTIIRQWREWRVHLRKTTNVKFMGFITGKKSITSINALPPASPKLQAWTPDFEHCLQEKLKKILFLFWPLKGQERTVLHLLRFNATSANVRLTRAYWSVLLQVQQVAGVTNCLKKALRRKKIKLVSWNKIFTSVSFWIHDRLPSFPTLNPQSGLKWGGDNGPQFHCRVSLASPVPDGKGLLGQFTLKHQSCNSVSLPLPHQGILSGNKAKCTQECKAMVGSWRGMFYSNGHLTGIPAGSACRDTPQSMSV